MIRHLAALLSFLLLIHGVGGVARAADPKEPTREQARFFESRVRPLLVQRCQKCHGPKKQNGDLRLDDLANLLQGGENGPAIVPGKPDESLLVEAINYETLEMPPDGKMSAADIQILTRWIAAGAPWPNARSSALPTRAKGGITDEDRRHWAFLPLQELAPPKVRDNGWSRNDIDRFVFRRLAQEGMRPAREAERIELVRRVYFDLIGLPPTPQEVDRFLADQSADAYANLVDELLARPEYGEKWARHWLDLVRYAESDGYKQDAYRPEVWRYRDYVVRSFNDDKPYDRFVMEQLAGDEIAPDDPSALVATGYLRHWIYEYNQRDARTQWEIIVNDITDVTADVFLGMGAGCARCHDHKFDPILRKDYFRLRAFFAPILPREDRPLGSPQELAAHRAEMSKWEEKTRGIRERIAAIERPHHERARKFAADKFPLDIRPMIMKPPSQRLPLEHQLASLAERQLDREVALIKIESKLKGEQKSEWKRLRAELVKFDSLKPKPLPLVPTVRDVGATAPVSFIPDDRAKTPIPPGFLSVLDPRDASIEPLPNSTGRRTALARWIANPKNTLSTRVIVNRIWQYHFGRGIVATSSDFGKLGDPPTHPELLDWLTSQFLSNGWRFKPLHRLILNSATYRQSALRAAPETAARIDPENRLLWRMNGRRLDAEQIRDTILRVCGKLDSTHGGPSVETTAPRRALYVKVHRNAPDLLLRAFDGPDGFLSTSDRNVTTTPTQSLLMINGDWTISRAKEFALLLQTSATDDAHRVTLAFRRAYGRPPTEDQLRGGLDFLQRARELASSETDAAPRTARIAGRDGWAANLDPSGPLRQMRAPGRKAKPPSGDFTIEAVFVLRSLFDDASVRTLVAEWDSNTTHPGWSFGVTSKKSKFQPRHLILQLVGKDASGKTKYEVVASNLRPELNRPYYAAVSIRAADTGPQGVTFYLRDLASPKAEVQVARVAHQVIDGHRGATDLTIGGRRKTSQHRWDGMVDDVRLSSAALNRSQLLLFNGKSEHVSGFWRFERGAAFRQDSTGGHAPLEVTGTADRSPPATQALIDFCHVLLNSNELIYID